MGKCWSKSRSEVPFAPSDSESPELQSSQYRFSVGTKVLCRIGADEWSTGKIIKLNYREADWPTGAIVPYQVQLDEGPLIYVPVDKEVMCKQLTLPWWAPILDQPDGCEHLSIDAAAELRQAGLGKNVNECNHKGESALLAAIRLNWISGVEILVTMRADVNIVDKMQASALHRACRHGVPMIKLLLKAQAHPNSQDTDPDYDPEFTSAKFGNRLEHRTSLHYCCAEGDLESVKCLLNGKADMNIQDAQFKAPLHLGIEEGHEDIIDFLLQSGAALDLCTLESGMKNTPLMEAAHQGRHKLAGKLIRAGADVNKVGKQDMTALHLAARRGDPKMAKMLLEAKADATLESMCGTALSLARKKKSAELLHLLGASEGVAGQEAAALSEAQRAALYMD